MPYNKIYAIFLLLPFIISAILCNSFLAKSGLVKFSCSNQHGEKIIYIIVCFMSFLLSSCAMQNANVDMLMAMVDDDIEQSEVISAEELYSILTRHFGTVRIKMSDPSYTLPDNGKVAQLSDFVYCSQYATEIDRPVKWDCDDYAIAAMVPLRNYAFGIMYINTIKGESHVINVYVNRKKEIVFWEPQNCQYYNGQFYKPELIIF